MPKTDASEAVDRWLDRCRDVGDADATPSLILRGLETVWREANRTLATVTLCAIGRRVLSAGRDDHPILGECRVDDDGFRFEALLQSDFDPEARRAAARFALTEFLRILGHLTAEVLTPSLHDALADVLPAPQPSHGLPANGNPASTGPKRSDDS